MPDTFETALLEAFDASEAAEQDDIEAGAEPTTEVEEPDEQPEEVEEDEPEEGDAEEGDDEDEDGEDDTEDPGPVTAQDETVLVLEDGTETTVRELREGALRRDDYTKKTQELAEARRENDELYEQMSTWYQERTADPIGWVEEIVSGTQDPTATIAQAIVSLAKAGGLDPEFVKTFGIDDGIVASKAKSGQDDDRISRLEREREQERQERAETEARSQAVAEYQRQYAEVVQSEGLSFDTPEEQTAFKASLVAFASEHKITDLRVAHDAMQRRTERQKNAAAAQESARQAKEQVTSRKKATQTMTPKGGSGATPQPRKSSFDEAATEAIEALARKGRL